MIQEEITKQTICFSLHVIAAVRINGSLSAALTGMVQTDVFAFAHVVNCVLYSDHSVLLLKNSVKLSV